MVCEAFTKFEKLFLSPRGIFAKNYQSNLESSEYSACSFIMQNQLVHFRMSKITPTKIGQFVTFWKRIGDSEIMPYDASDDFENLIIFAQIKDHQGIFIFPKQVLLQHKIISDRGIGGKRAIRVYPVWDKPENTQAKKTQAWQLKYFTQLN